jgi:zinc protease
LYVGSFSLPFEHPGLAVAFAIANAGVAADSLERSDGRGGRRSARAGRSPAELEKLKVGIETEFVTANARVAGIAENLASAYTFLGGTAKVNSELAEQYLSVTSADLKRVAREYFDPKKRVVLHYLPMASKQ